MRKNRRKNLFIIPDYDQRKQKPYKYEKRMAGVDFSIGENSSVPLTTELKFYFCS
jgi:hypothetical protein